MTDDACSFVVWLRPTHTGQHDVRYDVRFSIDEGRGVMRVSRPGVLVDPPAHHEGEITALSRGDLHASRFLLLPNRGLRRTYLFSDLTDQQLSSLAPAQWSALEVALINGQRCFQVSVLPEDEETSLFSNPFPVDVMPPGIRITWGEEARLRMEVQQLQTALALEKRRVKKLSAIVRALIRKLRQLQGQEEAPG